MKTTAKAAALVAAAVLGTVGAAWAVPVVSNVSMGQVAGMRMVQINYDLGGEDAIVTLSIETNGVAIPDSAVTWLSGDVCKKVTVGANKSILWDAGADWPENATQTAKARVIAWCSDAAPQVMVIDLIGGKDAATYPVLYYPSLEALPYGGPTNAIYKSSLLVMSKIARGAFNMGPGVCEVILTNDFYAGVFEVTQGQWAQVMGTTRVPQFPNGANARYRPMETVSYCDIRENPAGVSSEVSPNWPESGVVGTNSFMGLLRTRTSVAFDLPTEAQWEYACRAGTISYYNDGLDGDLVVADLNSRMNVLGRYIPNNIENIIAITAIVGSYRPNAWGLYDMHGNVNEWCLDWWEGALAGGTDPRGPVSGTVRVIRGGAFNADRTGCSSVLRNGIGSINRAYYAGFRLVITLP